MLGTTLVVKTHLSRELVKFGDEGVGIDVVVV